jgi:hypothetical protein
MNVSKIGVLSHNGKFDFGDLSLKQFCTHQETICSDKVVQHRRLDREIILFENVQTPKIIMRPESNSSVEVTFDILHCEIPVARGKGGDIQL